MATLGTKIRTRSFRLWKELYHRFLNRSPHQTTHVFIVGCQRSGTTLMDDVFDTDRNTKVYREVSKLSSFAPIEDGLRRFKPLMLVENQLRRDRAPLVVMKPLVETQQADHILEHFSEAKAIWMYRHYLDVASSNLAHFGIRNGINNIRPIAVDENSNWRSERVPEPTRLLVKKYFSEEMNPYDAAVLFWYVRNCFFFDLGLDRHPRVMMLNYETLVSNPPLAMQRVYAFLGNEYPGDHIVDMVKTSSLGKGRSVEISAEIGTLAADMLGRLDNAFAGQEHFGANERRLSSELTRREAAG
ncbi:MAG: sulfotransferase [Ignavibacteria bacterium]|nr:sulfotransferase [Ignavibacteria bacterium]